MTRCVNTSRVSAAGRNQSKRTWSELKVPEWARVHKKGYDRVGVDPQGLRRESREPRDRSPFSLDPNATLTLPLHSLACGFSRNPTKHAPPNPLSSFRKTGNANVFLLSSLYAWTSN